MKAEIVELQKSKLSSSVKLTEPRDSNVQHENARASTCDQYDDESILKIQRYSRHIGVLSRDGIDKGGFNNNLQSVHSKKHDDTFLSYWKCLTCRDVFG